MTSYITSEVRRVGSATGFLLKDGLGSVRFESQTGGTSSWRDYGPYGMPSNDKGLTVAKGRGYINERFDPETGLQYLHARYYDPNLWKFLSPDTWDRPSPAWISTAMVHENIALVHHYIANGELPKYNMTFR